MTISSERLIAPLLIISATSLNFSFSIPAGSFGISIEHMLLMLYCCSLLACQKSRASLWFILAAMLTVATGVFGAFFIHPSSLHLISFVILFGMFPLFIRYLQRSRNAKRIVYIAFLLILIQCIFFSNSSRGYEVDWDNIFIPGFGTFSRLAILEFVSNNLALMLLPFYIYFFHRIQLSSAYFSFDLLFAVLAMALIVATFSRTGFILAIFATLFTWKFKPSRVFLLSLVIIPTLVFWSFDTSIDLVRVVISAMSREGYGEDARLSVWTRSIASWTSTWSLMIIGTGLQNPPLDNTYLSFIVGAGVLGLITLLSIVAALVYWLFEVWKTVSLSQQPIFKTLLVLIIVLLVSANTYDIFSQRKIIFSFALIIGILLYDSKNSNLRG